MAENFEDRRPDDLPPRLERGEHRRLEHADADVETDNHEQRAGEKGNPPAPRHELGFVCETTHACERQVRHHQAKWCAELGKACDEAAEPWRRPFTRDQHRSAPLPSNRETLQGAKEREQHRAPRPDRRIRGDEPDRHGRQPHQNHRRDEKRLPADPIAEVAEKRSTERPRDKADKECREGQDRPDEWIRAGEKQLREHQCSGGSV
jgi:hypothetical protein